MIAAPSIAVAGRRTLWSAFLKIILEMCGTAIPIKPTGPQNAVILPASKVEAVKILILVNCRFTPKLLA